MISKKKISFAFVILFIFPLIVTGQNKLLQHEDMLNPSFYPAQLRNIQWITNENIYSYIKDDNLMSGDVSKSDDKVLLSLDDLNKALTTAGHGNMRRFPAINWIDKDLFRFVYGSDHVTFSFKNNEVKTLYTIPRSIDNAVYEPTTGFSAFTENDNLYIVKPGNNKTQITFDGGNGIVNGKAVHRREFGIKNGIFWSPEGNFLAFYRNDESMVTKYPLVDIGARVAEVRNIRYPMAGMTSEEVTVGVYDLSTGETIFLKTGEPKDQYLTNITWCPDEKHIYIAVLNREQKHMKLNRYNSTTGEFEKTLFEETSDFYVEPLNGLLFIPGRNDQFLWESRRNGWNHLYLYNTDGELLRRYTSGDWEVTNVAGFDKSGRKLFYYSTEASPLESQLYEVNLRRGRISRITTAKGTHRVLHSADGNYFIDRLSNMDGIASQINLINNRGRVIKTLLRNSDPLEGYLKPRIIIDTLHTAEGTPLYYRMLLPPDFDESKKYPVFVYVYGGPHSQLIKDNWLGNAGLFLTYMAQQGYIVFTLDNRGTNNRGSFFECVIHRQLGVIETKDQMKGIEMLLSLPYVDHKRIGLHGWSYGGFMTITMMHNHPGVFKAGVAGGPVVDWKYYEVMYGERYMETPEKNPRGYETTSLLNSLDKLEDRLLIIHGAVDDVVVWQHSLAYLNKSIEEKKMVDYFVYPMNDHGIRGAARIHLHRKIEQYFKDHLNLNY